MKRTLTRRSFVRCLSVASAFGLSGASAPFRVVGAARARLVVIGGGPAGLTVARRAAADGSLDVTLLEANRDYTTCFFSNHHLGGLRSFDSITHRYENVGRGSDVRVITARAEGVDASARSVRLSDGTTLGYDRLVVAPGIDFRSDAIEGYDERAAEAMPHAYSAPGTQAQRLRRAVESMPDGGLFVIAAPPDPYRCPPAPYERACMVAYHFSRHRPKAKILIVDAKDRHSMQDLFQQAWSRYYPGMVEWLPAEFTSGGVKAVNASAMELITADETFKAHAACVIPAQRAGAIARVAGLTDDSGWCPVEPLTMRSTLLPDVHVVGDSIIAGDMPKSAFAAITQARACADTILAELAGRAPVEPQLGNACWSLLAPDNAVKVAATYRPEGEGIARVDGLLSADDDSDAIRLANAREAQAWYASTVRGLFG